MAIKSSKIKITKKDFTWVDINSPTEKEVDYLRENYKFHELDLEDCLSESQWPKIDDHEDYLFLVLHVPIITSENHIKNTEINVFIGQDYIITLHGKNPIISKIGNNNTTKGSGHFLYNFIKELFDSCFPMVDELTKKMEKIELEVFNYNYSKDHLKDILLVKKDIINFRRIIMPQRGIIAELKSKSKKFLTGDMDLYFDDMTDKIERMWNSLENLHELIDSLHRTNESIISHNTNNIIKILTIFSVILLPLNLITGFYGMNVVGLPIAEHQFATEIIFGGILVVGISLILYFRHKKWL